MKNFKILFCLAIFCIFFQQLKADWDISEGIFCTYVTLPTMIFPKTETLDNIIILGDVEGKADVISVYARATAGEAGIEAAKRNALRAYPQADDIINIEVDTKKISIFLGTIVRVETILRGKAIKYKKGLPDTAQ